MPVGAATVATGFCGAPTTHAAPLRRSRNLCVEPTYVTAATAIAPPWSPGSSQTRTHSAPDLSRSAAVAIARAVFPSSCELTPRDGAIVIGGRFAATTGGAAAELERAGIPATKSPAAYAARTTAPA